MKRLIISFLGINIMAFALNAILSFNIGVGPFDSMTQVIQNIFAIEKFGNASLLLHLLFALTLLILSNKLKINKKSIVLSIITIFIISRIINFYAWIIPYENVQFSYTKFLLFFLILNLGLYLISYANLVIAPYDKSIVEFSNWTNVELGKIRVYGDTLLLVFVIIAKFIFKVDVTVTFWTLFISLGTGINMALYERIVKSKKNLKMR